MNIVHLAVEIYFQKKRINPKIKIILLMKLKYQLEVEEVLYL